MEEYEKQIILAYADNDMNAQRTSRHIYYHRNSMWYHFNLIQKKTGLDPRKFHDLVKLVAMAKEENNER